MRTITIVLTFVALGPTACKDTESPGPGKATEPASPSGPPSVRADGSSTVYPITRLVALEFEKANKDVKVTVEISGTGGGFKKFCVGETDVSNASRPIKPSEFELCERNGIQYLELPIAYDGLAVLVNPKNTWAKDITTAELKTLWEPAAQGVIRTWNQVRSTWPDKEIRLFGAGVDSGTYDYFTEAIVHREHASRNDFTSSEDDNVLVQGIAADPQALGFFGYAYYADNKDKLRVLPVDDGIDTNGKGAIAPSADTVANGTYQPLSRPIFIYVARKSLEKPAVSSFIDFYLRKGPRLIRETEFIPLSESVYLLNRERFKARRTGSVFGGKGSQVGVLIEDLLRKEMTTAAK